MRPLTTAKAGTTVPQLDCQLILLRLGVVTQKRCDVGAKWIGIPQRRHERVVVYTSTWLNSECNQLFTGATCVSSARSVPAPRTTLARMSNPRPTAIFNRPSQGGAQLASDIPKGYIIFREGSRAAWQHFRCNTSGNGSTRYSECHGRVRCRITF